MPVHVGTHQAITVEIPEGAIPRERAHDRIPCLISLDRGQNDSASPRKDFVDLGEGEDKDIPLHSRCELSVLKLRSLTTAPVPEVQHQILLTREEPRQAYEIQGVYGFEENDRDCMICYDRFKTVVLFSCRHCSVCPQCLRAFRDEKCPLCRCEFWGHVTMPCVLSRRNSSAPNSPRSPRSPKRSADGGSDGDDDVPGGGGGG